MRPLAVICIAAALVSCTRPVREGGASPAPVFRHANLEAVYTHLLEKSEEAAILRERRKTLESAPGGADPEALRDLSIREENLKTELYGRIRIAVKRVATRMGVDYVLDSSGSLLHAPSGDDITSDIIRELDLLAIRSEPASR